MPGGLVQRDDAQSQCQGRVLASRPEGQCLRSQSNFVSGVDRGREMCQR